MAAKWLRAPVTIALAATSLALAWQALTVHYNYGGNWTALFGVGARFLPLPNALVSEHIFRFPGSRGYDGQVYHIMAHDPFTVRHFWPAIDSPRYRYRRILVPVLAWTVALGQDRFVDRAYLAVILFCIFLAALWIAALARLDGLPVWWALGLFAVPAVVVSLDRMTVDVALIAVIAGVAYYARKKSWANVFWLCICAGLVRETGLLVPIGMAAWFVFRYSVQRAIAMALSAAPALLWYLYVNARLPAGFEYSLSPVPFAGLIARLASPYPYAFGVGINLLATSLDYLALTGILMGFLYCAWNVRRLKEHSYGWVAFGFALMVVPVSSQDVWRDAFGFARVFSPLLFLTALDCTRTNSLAGALPVLLTAPRIWLQFGFQVLGVWYGVWRQ